MGVVSIDEIEEVKIDLLRKKAELASQAAMEMRKKAGLYKLLLK